jgi:formylglycine-generating enzyme required for sulfatase activity
LARWLLAGALVSLAAWRAGAQTPSAPMAPVTVRTAVNPADGAEMVIIPGGKFTMGFTSSGDSGRRRRQGSEGGQGDELPAHPVTVSAFAMYRFEVTNAQYDAFCKATGHRRSAFAGNSKFGQPKQPVVGVTWDDAVAYCKWAGARLPTEAEWEYAARGTDGRPYPWGATRPSAKHARYDETDGPLPVGSCPEGASPFGCQDMAGNAWEWVADYYDYAYYQRSPERDPQGPEKGVRRVLRGGCWGFPAELRATFRAYDKPSASTNYIGFRCASVVPSTGS